jgi:hypothetical protein
VLEELLDEKCASSRNRHNPRGVKRKISNYPRRLRGSATFPPVDFSKAVKIIKWCVLKDAIF